MAPKFPLSFFYLKCFIFYKIYYKICEKLNLEGFK